MMTLLAGGTFTLQALPEQGLQLFDALNAGRQPMFQQGLGRHGIKTGASCIGCTLGRPKKARASSGVQSISTVIFIACHPSLRNAWFVPT
jgi:hypothetical protein